MKRTKKIQTMITSVALAVALGAPVAFAQSGTTGTDGVTRTERRMKGKHRKQGRREGRLLRRVMSQLDLTDAQKAQIKQIRASHRESVRPVREQIRAKRLEMRQASQGGTFDQALTNQKLTEMAALKAKLMAEQFQIRQETLAVLTPEQKTKLEQLREQFKANRAERRARRS